MGVEKCTILRASTSYTLSAWSGQIFGGWCLQISRFNYLGMALYSAKSFELKLVKTLYKPMKNLAWVKVSVGEV